MPEQSDKLESVELDEVNEDLTRALKSCHSIVEDYRLKFAANSNHAEAAYDGSTDADHQLD